MAGSGALAGEGSAPTTTARLHSMLRFAAGTTAAFVTSEAMGWYPTFLPPLFAAMLLANLPGALPLKAGMALLLVHGAGAYGAFVFASLFSETPFVLFGAVALVLFGCFACLAQGRAMLPFLLVLIAFAAVPIVTIVAPQQASALAWAFVRSLAVAVCVVWSVHAVWPADAAASPPPAAAAFERPLRKAVAGTAIVLPLLLVYLMYGITDALPVLITTIVLVTTFEPRRGATQAGAMVIGNFVGGLSAVAAVALLQLAHHLATLSLITFLMGILFASRIERGGPAGAVTLVTYNQAMVMFGLALVPGGSDTGVWLGRLLQFAVAGLFAVGMMLLLLPRCGEAPRPS